MSEDTHVAALSRVPGTVSVSITTYHRGDKRFEHLAPDGQLVQEGASVREWRMRLGGDETIWLDPIQGKKHKISTAEYAQLDENVMLRIGWKFTPKQPMAAEYQALFSPPTAEQRARGTIVVEGDQHH